jgi:hypothetical protein
MKKLVMFGMVALVVVACGIAYGASSVNQTVTYQVTAVNEISVSGNPSALIVNSATAGSEPDAASDNSTTYAITTNESSKKITGAINSVMPDNTSLKVTLGAPTGGTSAGQVTLSTSAQDLVTGISTLAESGKSISYVFSATSAAGVVSSASKTVTLTVADGS